MAKILTWRWKPEPNQSGDNTKKGRSRQRQRELFVKWHDKSYWNCEWISELQVRFFYFLIYFFQEVVDFINFFF